MSVKSALAKTGLAGSFSRLRALLRARHDTEHEVSINRIAILTVILVNWAVAAKLGSTAAAEALYRMAPALAVFGTAAILIFAHLLWRPAVSHVRRSIAVPLDVCGMSYGIYLSGDGGAMLYPLYIWAILGYGFRYGLRYMTASVFVSVAAFGAAMYATPFWSQHVDIGIGLTLGLFVIPAYAATLIRKLSEATCVAEEASKAKSLFLASVSHELRTPLNAIVGLSDLLADSPLGAEQGEMVRTIGKAGRSLSSLINSILDVSRMEIGRMSVKTDEFDLHAFLADIRDLMSVQASAKSLRMVLNVAPGVPRRAILARHHLEEILVNLAGNAVKFTHEGFVMISVSDLPGETGGRRLRFEVRDTGIGIAADAKERIFERFSQADDTIIDRYGGTGLGLTIAKQLVEGGGGRIGVDSAPGAGSTFWFEIACGAPDAVANAPVDHPVVLLSADRCLRERLAAFCPDLRCFDTFADARPEIGPLLESGAAAPVIAIDGQSPGSDFENVARACLALAPSARAPLVWLREPVDAKPDPASLSLFCSTARRDAGDDEIASALAIARTLCRLDREEAGDGAGTTPAGDLDILVAEDNRTNQLVIRKILENAGHRVTLAENGEQAMEHLGARKFDVVFMDVNMPVLNGIETAKLARFVELDDERTAIVALTADATVETRRRCLEAGMDDILTKPIDRQALLAWLGQFQAAKIKKASRPEVGAPDDQPAAPALPAADQPIDETALRDLESLGGKAFVDQIVDQFVTDAASVLRELAQSVATGDAHAFREQAHALRSCAANVGARRVYELCLEWRAIDSAEVATRGEACVRQLEDEFSRVREALAKY